MKFLLRSFASRSSRLGLLSDIAMVTAAAVRVARKPATGSTAASARMSAAARPGEWILVGGAAFRLLRRIRAVRKQRKDRAALAEES